MRLCIGPNDMQSLSIAVRCLTVCTEGGAYIEAMLPLSMLEGERRWVY